MAVTTTLQSIVTLTQIFIRSAPLTGLGGTVNEPALSIGNWVRNIILSPPFGWNWNRGTGTFTTIPGQQDYAIAIPDFGWLERASLIDTTVDDITSRELLVDLNLGVELAPNEPGYIAARINDNAGNITFRLSPPPNTPVKIKYDYQKASPSFAALTDTWAPIPDYMTFLCQQGFLTKTYEYWNDERFPIAMQTFIGSLISANGGLSESQIDIFTQARFNEMRQAGTQSPQNPRKAKGLY